MDSKKEAMIIMVVALVMNILGHTPTEMMLAYICYRLTPSIKIK